MKSVFATVQVSSEMAMLKGVCVFIAVHLSCLGAHGTSTGSSGIHSQRYGQESKRRGGGMRGVGMESLDISETGALRATHGPRKPEALEETRAHRTKSEAWQLCSPNCTCSSRRRMVIRFKPRTDTDATLGASPSSAIGSDGCDKVSWYYRQCGGYPDDTGSCVGNDPPEVGNPNSAFNKGFDFSDPTKSDVSTIAHCGSTHAVCPMPGSVGADEPQPQLPTACHFDNSAGGNPFDAQEGWFCCSASAGYCSYRCLDDVDETFTCPIAPGDGTDVLPGGFDPCQNWPKACYSVHHADGSTPDTGDDSGTL